MSRVLVLGAGGFIGDHLVEHHKRKGDVVTGVDLKMPEFRTSLADIFFIADLTRQDACAEIFSQEYDIVYQLAANMGGAGFIFTGENDADIMGNDLMININVLENLKHRKQKLLFTSSACVYPQHNQLSAESMTTAEHSAYPADPDSDYGWEKLTSERLYQAYARNYGMDNHIVRLHNIYGIRSTYQGGREKYPAAICRKVAESTGEIEIWGDGSQVRSFLYIDDMLSAFDLILKHGIRQPINVGSKEHVTVNELAAMVIDISSKDINMRNVPGPVGVSARTSDNTLIESLSSWQPKIPLREGMDKLYRWIEQKTNKGNQYE